MEGENQMETSAVKQEMWISPVELASVASTKGRSDSMKTPNVPSWPFLAKRLIDSGDSSNQDSGYCSMTPQSGDSFTGLFDKICPMCHKSISRIYASTPQSMPCRCRKNIEENISPHLEYMKTINENKVSLVSPQFSSQVCQNNRKTEMFFEPMDTSLYPEEIEMGAHVTGENYLCGSDLTDLCEEKSIDIESGFCSSSAISKDSSSVEGIKPNKIAKEEEREEFFSPECEMVSHHEHPSSKMSNETTPTKLKRGSTDFPSVAKKVATMNRVIRSFNLNGLEKIDFLYQLGSKDKSLPLVIGKILGFLSEKDLDSVRLVSKTWNTLFYQDLKSVRRWNQYCNCRRMMKENITSPTKYSSPFGSPRSPMKNMTNHNHCSPGFSNPWQLSPPVSPKSARFHSFQKAGKLLKEGERLLQCPKCFFASTDHGSPIVQCPRSGCRHRFCVWCRNEAVPSTRHKCPPPYTPRSLLHRSSSTIGSKSSKRNLRRL